MSKALYVFKLFNSIKDEHEVAFAELELKSLFGQTERVRSFVDLIPNTSLSHFSGDECRIQDILTYEPVYGKYQGFLGWRDDKNAFGIGQLIRRLSYTREILVVTESDDINAARTQFFPEGVDGRNIKGYAKEGYVLLRAVTNQYFLEKSSYISKLSRHETDVDRNVESLFDYPWPPSLYRIPASSTMAVGKRLEDYFAIREEQSLYLTHMWHPYKAKFHSRMARALLNYVCPNDDSLAMDNWTGSGTLNVEATLMGMTNIGLEINPLSALMASVKCQALSCEPKTVKKEIANYLDKLQANIQKVRAGKVMTSLVDYGGKVGSSNSTVNKANEIRAEAEKINTELKGLFTVEQVEEFVVARDLINENYKSTMKNFMLLALSGSISDLARRRKGRLLEVMTLRLYKLMYLRLYLYGKLNEVLDVKPGKSETFVCDNKRPLESSKSLDGSGLILRESSVGGVVTSPPYSTAVDYIRNDFPQLRILGLVRPGEFDDLEKNMEGNPKPRLYRDEELITEVTKRSNFYENLPKIARDSIAKLREAGRKPEAIRTYKFFKDMHASLVALNKLLKVGGKCAIVIGNNHYKISETEELEVRNDEVIFELAQRMDVGFAPDKLTGGLIQRPLEKTQAGYIRNETVVILEKVRNVAEVQSESLRKPT
jgi:DNA modification methylase